MKKFQLKKQEPKEIDIQNAVCEYLEAKGHFFYRSNNTPIFQSNGQGGGFFRAMGKYSLKGVPDIVMIDKGQYIGLEIKRPSGIQSEEQALFQKNCIGKGGQYHLIRSIDDVIALNI